MRFAWVWLGCLGMVGCGYVGDPMPPATPAEAQAWLLEQGLVPGGNLPTATMLCYHLALSSAAFGPEVNLQLQKKFL